MKSLDSYEVLVNDTFYRSEHILSYIKRRIKNGKLDVSYLDQAALENTILDALVYAGKIDPNTESLDLDNFGIVDDHNHTIYDKHPFVLSIPMEIKEKMRHRCLIISGSVPISIFYAKPAGGAHYCIYDMNTALSVLFDDFSFVLCDYDSPTREGVRAIDRPFLEIEYNGVSYYVDALTKRMFIKEMFDRFYNIEVKERITKSSFDKRQKEIYSQDIKESNQYANYLLLTLDLYSGFKGIPTFEETLYEIEKSKSIYPESFTEADMERENVLHLFGRR